MTDPKNPDNKDELNDDELDDVAGGAVDMFLKNKLGTNLEGVKTPDSMTIDASTPKARCGIAYQCPE